MMSGCEIIIYKPLNHQVLQPLQKSLIIEDQKIVLFDHLHHYFNTSGYVLMPTFALLKCLIDSNDECIYLLSKLTISLIVDKLITY